MIELLKKGILTGIGLASLTREKIEEWGNEITKQGYVSENEGRELVAQLVEITERDRKNMESKIETAINRVLDKIDIVRKGDLNHLEQRIAILEKETRKRQ